jgi:hypothetical protein
LKILDILIVIHLYNSRLLHNRHLVTDEEIIQTSILWHEFMFIFKFSFIPNLPHPRPFSQVWEKGAVRFPLSQTRESGGQPEKSQPKIGLLAEACTCSHGV